MNAITDTARLLDVSDDGEARGQAIRRRRLHHGIKSVREMADKSGISREALTAAEKGDASGATYERVEAWLARFEEEIGDDRHASEDGVVEFHIAGNFGVDVVVKGPASHLAELEAAVEKLVRAAQTDPK